MCLPVVHYASVYFLLDFHKLHPGPGAFLGVLPGHMASAEVLVSLGVNVNVYGCLFCLSPVMACGFVQVRAHLSSAGS